MDGGNLEVYLGYSWDIVSSKPHKHSQTSSFSPVMTGPSAQATAAAALEGSAAQHVFSSHFSKWWKPHHFQNHFGKKHVFLVDPQSVFSLCLKSSTVPKRLEHHTGVYLGLCHLAIGQLAGPPEKPPHCELQRFWWYPGVITTHCWCLKDHPGVEQPLYPPVIWHSYGPYEMTWVVPWKNGKSFHSSLFTKGYHHSCRKPHFSWLNQPQNIILNEAIHQPAKVSSGGFTGSCGALMLWLQIPGDQVFF